ncbi:MAG: ribosomal protein S18-alanine N-acetyltransferase [Gammaproteobacteria bacterium]
MSRDLVEQGLGWSWRSSRIVRHIRSAESIVLVARSHGQIIGFAIMHFGEEEAHLDLLAVKPTYQRTGIGRQLIEWLEKSALVAGISIIYLEVRAKNREARMFYERLGYRRIRQVQGYYSGRESAVCMAIDLWYSRCSTAT